ncbi:MAG: hypothetical protein JNL97_06950, partial [Verrucomicrobiales bacterium]|nr:hypothetical protein [Verrucomicrobiales bacterium]
MDTPAFEVVFAKALELGPGPEREAFLAEACRGRDAVRVSVESLLAAHDAAGGFLETRSTVSAEEEEGATGATAGGSEPAMRATVFLRDVAEGKAPTLAPLLEGLEEGARREVAERILTGLRVRGRWSDRAKRRAEAGSEHRTGEAAGPEPWPRIPGFRLEAKLGQGGLGVVYGGFDEKL